NGLTGIADFPRLFVKNDLVDRGANSRRTYANGIARLYGSTGDSSSKPAEVVIATVDPLHRHRKRSADFAMLDRNSLEPVEQRLSLIPTHFNLAELDNILAFQSRKRDCRDCFETEILSETSIGELDFFKRIFGPIQQIHFVNGQRHMADTQHG